MRYRCDICRRDVEVTFAGYDHSGPGLMYEYRCQPGGHLIRLGAHQVQPQRTSPR